MAAQAARGKKALEVSDFATALEAYNAAIIEAPTSPEFFIQRSTAHQRLGMFEEALEDADQGVLNAQRRAKKEAVIDGQYRRALALYKLARYGDAEFVLQLVKKLKSDHKQVDMMISKIATELNKLPEDDERRRCTVTETPNTPENVRPGDFKTATSGSVTSTTGASTSASVAAPTLSQTPADKIRHEWYQNTENVYFTLLAKGVPKDKAHVEITERSLSISFPLATGSSYELTLDPLFAAVVPDKCITRVMPSKTEIILIKATPGQKWSALESSEPVVVKADSVANTEDDAVKKAIFSEAKQSAPLYPTSSKNGPKDWDKLAKDIRISDRQDSVEDDDDYDGGDPTQNFFKKLYKGASPDMQKAMVKSYTESNGTNLSTDWENVQKARVETIPPDEMEAKEWNK